MSFEGNPTFHARNKSSGNNKRIHRCLEAANIHPNSGLFIGAIGQVVNIVYDKSVVPNGNKRERLPRYIVVDFPLFKPPANVEVWDKNNPMVSERHTALTLAACC